MSGKYKKCIFPFKSEGEFRIPAEECLTFETVTSCLAQRLRSHVLAGLWAVAPSCTFSPDFKIAGKDDFKMGQLFHSRQILYGILFGPRVLRGRSNTSRAHSRPLSIPCFGFFVFRVCE